jgi:uncharacterized membrane protein YagU involved in acid resistance
MTIGTAGVLAAVLIGAGATLLLEGKFAHASIASAPPMRYECAVGWISHYAIGAVFALVFVALAPTGWLARPTLFPALLFGLVTVLFPYLIMQPALGFGVAAASTPNPAAVRLKSLMNHGVFGIGLYLSAIVAGQL